MAIMEEFLRLMAQKPAPRVLELGTCRADNSRTSMHKEWVPHAKEYIGSDFQPGMDVDVIANAHYLSEVFGENNFDAVICCAVYEHLQYPWLATVEICKVLKPGGLVFIHAPQSFPVHGYPYDYWRYTTESLRALFSRQVGFNVLETAYEFPCRLISEDVPGIAKEPAFLNILLTAEKIAHPPANFSYAADKIPVLIPADFSPKGENFDEHVTALIEGKVPRDSGVAQKVQLSKNKVERYTGLKSHPFFGPFIRAGDYLLNYPAEAKTLQERWIHVDRYKRLDKNWFFGPILRLGTRIADSPPKKA